MPSIPTPSPGAVHYYRRSGNSFALNFGWHDDVDGGRRSSLIDVLVTLRVADAAFANDLFLTNQLRVNEFSTNAGVAILR